MKSFTDQAKEVLGKLYVGLDREAEAQLVDAVAISLRVSYMAGVKAFAVSGGKTPRVGRGLHSVQVIEAAVLKTNCPLW